jgi:nicotinamidase/pyrazinamidase
MPDPTPTALIAVDLQPDFMPGGALPVAEGDRMVEPIARLLRSGAYELVVATQDWHPPGHVSFASSHPGKKPFDVISLHGHDQVLWPDHCVQGTPGAALHAGLPLERVEAIVRKGTDPLVDSYSGIRNNWDARGRRPVTGLAGYLRERGVQHVTICGLARDYCVQWTAEDAAVAGFHVRVLWDLTRPVDPAGDDGVRAALMEKGVDIV